MATVSSRIVICGAGMAGGAAAYHLAVQHKAPHVVLLQGASPPSLPPHKPTEAYRSWCPGPDRAMTSFMTRSIHPMEEFARTPDNRINMNRRGYLFATAEASKVSWLHELALTAEAHGSGPVRMHEMALSPYT